jgi:hypothetical protein
MWERLASLMVSCACFSDTGLVDPTPADPMSSLKKTRTIAKFAWKQPQSVLTHGQGSPGSLRPAVGGTMVATDDALSRILGLEIVDPRGWGRFVGRILVGKDKTSLVVVTAYFPCTSSKNSPGSAWQTQLALMQELPIEERLRDPWFQCLADLQRVLWLLLHEGASQPALTKRRIVLSADFNARWVNPKPEASDSQQRTRALRAFAKLLGLAEPMSYLHPAARPQTFYKSEMVGSQSSWIDYFLVSTPLLEQGIIMEAGVLQDEQVNGSDHRLSVIDINIDALLCLGEGWAPSSQTDPKLQKLPLDSAKTSSAYQCRALELWDKHSGQACIDAAVRAVDDWASTRDHAADEAGTSDWGDADPVVLAHLDAALEVLMTVTVGAWRKAQNCLPSYQRIGSKRKDGWSPVCVAKMRNLRCLLDVVAMWNRGSCSRESILCRASDLASMQRTLGAAPSPNAYHVDWRQWISHVRSRIPILRGELHGVKRKLLQEQMLDAADRRNARWDSGRQKSCIANWLQKSRGGGPMRSTIVRNAAGDPTLVLGEVALRGCLDTRFDHWMSERLFQKTPLDTFWYQSNGGHLLAAPEGRQMRMRAARGALTATEVASVPERYRSTLDAAAVKHVPGIPGPYTPDRYDGCMQPVTLPAYVAYWAHTKKGTAPGGSQMSVNMVWTLQMTLNHAANGAHAAKYLPPGTAPGDKVCLTPHLFDATRVFTNLILRTGIIPTRLLAEVLYPIDKIDGLVDIANKRPIGLVEVLIQAVFGLQYAIVERTWERDGVLSTVQCGYTRKKTCEFPVMDITIKAEYAYIYRVFLAVLWMDQSKAFDTLHLYLGIEMPLRRVAIPEKLIVMTVNCKYGSWCMVATVYGPTELDWQILKSHPLLGINKLLPDQTLAEGAFGFDPMRGTTQGSKHGPSVFKAYYDWKVTLQEKTCFDLAPYRDSMGNIASSLGNALADDSNYTNSTLEGSLHAMAVAALFFAFMGGCLNLDKTKLTILDWVLAPDGTPTDKYKVHCPEESVFDTRLHLPKSVQILDPRTVDRIETTTALLAAAEAGLPAGPIVWDQDSALNLPSCDVALALRTRLAWLETQRYATVDILAPDDAVKYLGVWLPTSLRYNKALVEARAELTSIAECLQCASITPAQLSEVVRMTGLQLGSYRLRMTSLFPEQLDSVDSRLTMVVKQKSHMCSTHPTLAFAASMHVTLTNQILVDKVCMFLRMVEARHTVSEAIRGSLWMLQRWIGSNTPALEYEHVEAIGWNGTWIGSLAICIRRAGLDIAGGLGIPHMRKGDACLVDLVAPADKPLVALGCWTHSVWRVSDLINNAGDRSVDFTSCAWVQPTGWLDKIVEVLDCWADSSSAPLGAWHGDTLHDRKYLLCRADPDVTFPDMIRVVASRWDELDCVVLPRVAKRKLHRRSLSLGERPESWLELLGGAGCDCLPDGEHTHACFVWADSADDASLPRITVTRGEVTPCGFTTRAGVSGGCSPRKVTFVAVDEGSTDPGHWLIDPPAHEDALREVDVDTITGVSFEDAGISHATRCVRSGAWARTCVDLEPDSILYVYSDCSLIRKHGVAQVSYGWVTAGLCDPLLTDPTDPLTWPYVSDTELDFQSLERGAWGGGRVSGPQLDMSTSRGEAFGVLAVMLFYYSLLGRPDTPPTLRVWSFCDNKGVCDRFNGDPDVHGDYDPGIDPDLWSLLFHLKGVLGSRFRLTWQRSHPELRKARAAYHRHNWGNLWSDVLADRAMLSIPAFDDRPHLGSSLAWGVKWGGELITKDIRKSMLAALKAESFVKYLEVNRGWDPVVLDGFPKARWCSKLTLMSDASTAVVLNKFVTGWLATLTVQAKRSSDSSFATACRLCGGAQETNWHVVAECTHPTMASARRLLMAKILAHIEGLPLPPGVKKLVSLNWLVADDGALANLSTEAGLATALELWAPELADTISAIELRQQLMWDTTHGPHGDDLRKWAFRGILPAHWDSLLTSRGVPPAEATAALLGIEKLVCDTAPELWREFCGKVHQDTVTTRTGSSLTDRVRLVFAAWDGPVPHGLERDVLKWTPKSQRTWMAKINRKRRHAAQLAEVGARDAECHRTALTRITAHFEVLPAALVAAPLPGMAARGRSFASGAKTASKRLRLRQVTLRDVGCELGSVVVPRNVVAPGSGCPADPVSMPPVEAAMVLHPQVPPQAAQAVHPPHALLYRVTLRPTPTDDSDIGAWVASGLPSLTFQDTAGHSACITRVNATNLLSPVAHLGPDVYEIMMAAFGPIDRFDLPHSAPYAASYHARLLADPLCDSIPRRGGWFALYSRAIPVLAKQVAAPGHHGICIPIHADSHWLLLVLSVHDASFTVYNSMARQGHGTRVAQAAITVLRSKLSAMGLAQGLTIDWGMTSHVPYAALAQQYDVSAPGLPGGDCLLFVGCWSLCVQSGVTPTLLTVAQPHMRNVRTQLFIAILDADREMAIQDSALCAELSGARSDPRPRAPDGDAPPPPKRRLPPGPSAMCTGAAKRPASGSTASEPAPKRRSVLDMLLAPPPSARPKGGVKRPSDQQPRQPPLGKVRRVADRRGAKRKSVQAPPASKKRLKANLKRGRPPEDPPPPRPAPPRTDPTQPNEDKDMPLGHKQYD